MRNIGAVRSPYIRAQQSPGGRLNPGAPAPRPASSFVRTRCPHAGLEAGAPGLRVVRVTWTVGNVRHTSPARRSLAIPAPRVARGPEGQTDSSGSTSHSDLGQYGATAYAAIPSPLRPCHKGNMTCRVSSVSRRFSSSSSKIAMAEDHVVAVGVVAQAQRHLVESRALDMLAEHGLDNLPRLL